MFSKNMEELLVQQERVSKKLALASEIREYLRRSIDALKQELIAVQKEKEITSYAKAARFARIRYNLTLLGQLGAYETELNKKIVELKAIGAELSYRYQQLADDLKIIQTVNHVEATERLKKVKELISNHSWLDQPYLFETEDLVLARPERIWANLMSQKQH